MSIEEIEKEEFYEHFKYVAHEGQEPLRVDKFLMNFIENTTRNKIQQAAKAGNCEVRSATLGMTSASRQFLLRDNVCRYIAGTTVK